MGSRLGSRLVFRSRKIFARIPLVKKTSISSLILRYRYSFLTGLVSLTLVDMAQLSVPIVIQWIIDELTLESADFSLITKYSLYILGLGLLMAFFRLGWRYFIMGGARKIEYSLRNDFFDHLQKLNFDFFSGRKVGDLMAHTVNDIETLKFSCGLGLLIAYDGVFLFFFIFAAMIYISPEMAFYAFLPFPVLAVFIYKFGNMIEKRFQRSQDSFSELTESARKPVSGIKVVKAFGLERAEGRDFERASEDYLEKNVRLVKIRAGFQPFIYFVPSLAMALFLFFGGAGAIGTEITLGEFSAILIYLMMLAWPMMAMGWAIDLLKRGNASINRLNDIFAVEQKDDTRAGEKDYELKGDIRFSGVSFSYGSTPALREVNLRIPCGTTLGITGLVGSGKTTLMKLLMKIHETEPGAITVDGIDIREISRKSLQETIVYVPQEITVFSGTVYDNITFINPSITQEQVEQAAKTAGIYEQIMEFQQGFDTVVGERGLSLSGGQRQRLAIARALVLNPEVLILDDVLSSLDPQTENTVITNVIEAMRGRTVVIISNRISSVVGLSRIAVMKNGEIIESGERRELVERRGVYYALERLQSV
ncbi:MAG: ABC transporter ATP-binding protein [Candidatus Dadabacteria bacterium]|nr:ABC transporter ATP-binding protein [Candidatus Dadabacteria bacterium]